jgi:CRISPR-associated protein Cas2
MANKKKKKEITARETNLNLAKAALPTLNAEEILAVENEIPFYFGRFLEWFKRNEKKNADDMYCFILYDIENNKIRRLLAKYLEKKGCVRIQKSVFFAKVPRKMYLEIKSIATDLQKVYDNQDTIILLPVGEEPLNNMHCIGKNFDFELLTQHKHTLIF